MNQQERLRKLNQRPAAKAARKRYKQRDQQQRLAQVITRLSDGCSFCGGIGHVVVEIGGYRSIRTKYAQRALRIDLQKTEVLCEDCQIQCRTARYTEIEKRLQNGCSICCDKRGAVLVKIGGIHSIRGEYARRQLSTLDGTEVICHRCQELRIRDYEAMVLERRVIRVKRTRGA